MCSVRIIVISMVFVLIVMMDIGSMRDSVLFRHQAIRMSGVKPLILRVLALNAFRDSISKSESASRSVFCVKLQIQSQGFAYRVIKDIHFQMDNVKFPQHWPNRATLIADNSLIVPEKLAVNVTTDILSETEYATNLTHYVMAQTQSMEIASPATKAIVYIKETALFINNQPPPITTLSASENKALPVYSASTDII